MLFNKIAAAVLIVGITAMAVGKISGLIIPDQGGAIADAGAGAGPDTTPSDPDPGFPAALAGADVAKGRRQIGKCLACHTVNKGGPNRVGPNLWGIVNRKKGTHPGFKYTDVMKGAGGTWTFKALYEFLAAPQKAMPGTKMAYAMGKWKQRRDLLAYLATLGDTPVALPKVEAPKKPEGGGDGKKPDGGDTKKPDGAGDGKKPDGAGDGKKTENKAPEKKEPVKKEPAKSAPENKESEKKEPEKKKDSE